MKIQRWPLALALTFALASCSSPKGATTPAPIAGDVVSAKRAAVRGSSGAGDPALPGLVGDPELVSALAGAYAAKGKDYVPRTHHKNAAGQAIFVNRLIFETSPYLLQHAHNPVNWYPWGDEAFERARTQGKPVLMSIGYSTCHWCHVMERESFEDLEIAELINRHFIAIKVDREERPDVDGIYMTAVNMLAGRGGWPMTTVLTPDREPFFGGTYFPARTGDRGSRKGFLQILGELAERYRTDRDGVVAKAKELSERIARASRPQPAGGVPGVQALTRAAQTFARSFDATWGGFSRAPKFPRPSSLEFLLRYARRSGDRGVMEMVALTLARMAAGGMHDQVGGGFHRYSVDSRWLVPHFEKMLYDNAQLTVAYLDGYQASKDADFARVARRTLDYVRREMTAPGGGFYSATDADSPAPSGHDEEGLYFTWTPSELAAILTPEEVSLISRYHGVTPRGNFEGRTIMWLPKPHRDVAKELGVEPAALRADIDAIYAKLYPVRATRAPPIKDTKIITAWNGLMIRAFARGALVLDEPGYAAAAAAAATFVLDKLRSSDGRLQRTYKDGQSRFNAYLEDYAFVVEGLLALHEATGEPRWLREAIALQATQDEHHADDAGGGYFTTSDDHETLLVRDKPSYDGAEPSGNSVAAMNLLRLHELTGDEAYRSRAERSLRAFAVPLGRGSTGVPRLLSALDFYLDSPREVVIVAPDAHDEQAMALEREFRRAYLPNRIFVSETEGDGLAEHARQIPLLEGKRAIKGQATAFVCEQGRCEAPTSQPDVFARQLAALARPITVGGDPAQRVNVPPPGPAPKPWEYDPKSDQHWHPGHGHWHKGKPPGAP